MSRDFQAEYAANRLQRIDRIRCASTLDAAYLLYHYNHWERNWGPPPKPSAIELSEVFPDHDPCSYREAEVLAEKMFKAAFDMIRGGHEANAHGVPYRETYEPSRQRFVADNPGFSESSYESAIYAANVALR